MHILEMALQFILARETVLAAVLASDDGTWILDPLSTVSGGIVPPKVGELGGDGMAVLLRAFVLSGVEEVTLLVIYACRGSCRSAGTFGVRFPTVWNTAREAWQPPIITIPYIKTYDASAACAILQGHIVPLRG